MVRVITLYIALRFPDNVMNIIYIVLPTIPLLLLLIVANGVFCFKLFTKRYVIYIIGNISPVSKIIIQVQGS